MSKWFRQYLLFSRTERMGLMVLCFVMVLLIAARVYMRLGVQPALANSAHGALIAATRDGSKYQQSDAPITYPEHQDKNAGYQTSLPDIVDINSADSATLVQLRGIGPVTAHNIMKRRINKGIFTSIDELKEVGGFSNEVLAILKRHLVFVGR
jgi:DNA uptake protein ComE-like DNA-binding protein